MSTETGPPSRVDFSQFKNGDRVRVTFEGRWEDLAHKRGLRLNPDRTRTWLDSLQTLRLATSAELLEPAPIEFKEGDVVVYTSSPLFHGEARIRGPQHWHGSSGSWTTDKAVAEKIRAGGMRLLVKNGKAVDL